MSDVTKAACIQFCSGVSPEANLDRLSGFVAMAVEQGAQWIVTPETSNFMPANRDMLLATARTENEDLCVAGFKELARRHKIWLQAGSFILLNGAGRPVNRSLMFAPDGNLVARYDKIHLFDVTLADGESHRESANYAGGGTAVVVKLPFGSLGMSVCYDLRFAGLYRSLAETGAQYLTVPSAFTKPTGAAHWEVLLRARAVETGCYVLAPAQSGLHENGRETYGHSLIIDPWGQILAELADGEGVIIAALDMARLEKTRRQIPVLEHGKNFITEIVNDPL
ncbi:MAG: carbon-nitrogen hydrolase family protein [Parvibaculales bacterium]